MYINNFEYKTQYGSASLTSLNKVFNAEGYVDEFANSTSYSGFCYYRTDHLGNVCEVWRAAKPGGALAATLQKTFYFPSGLPLSYSTSPGLQPNKYNNKPFIEMHGFDTYDFSARMMYPAIGDRFLSVDPLAEKYFSISPYAYCAGNPVNRIDPDGRKIFIVTGNDIILSSVENMKQTEIGLSLWNKYDKSKTDDVYITSQQFQKIHAGGYTYANAQKYSIIKNGKVSLNSNNLEQSDMSNINGLDVSKSIGKNIHLININENTASKDGSYGKNKFDNGAYAIFNELDAHVDKDKTYNSELGHKLHGMTIVEKEINGKKLQTISIEKGSDAWNSIMQLIELRKKNEEKNR